MNMGKQCEGWGEGEEEECELYVFYVGALWGRPWPYLRAENCANEGNARECKTWWQSRFKLFWVMSMLTLDCVHQDRKPEWVKG